VRWSSCDHCYRDDSDLSVNAFAPLLRFLPSTEVEIAEEEEEEEEEEEQKYHTSETNNYSRILVQNLWNCTTISTASQGSITTLLFDLHDSKKRFRIERA